MKTASFITKFAAGKIRYRREQFGMSQEDLAELSGLHRTYIGSIERAERNITLTTLDKIAIALDCEISELLPRKSDKGRIL